jgi:hypothetical protein
MLKRLRLPEEDQPDVERPAEPPRPGAEPVGQEA